MELELTHSTPEPAAIDATAIEAPVPRVYRSTICRACGKQTMEVTYSRAGKLGRARKRKCRDCGAVYRTLEVEIVPGLKRAIRRLHKANGVQLPLFPES